MKTEPISLIIDDDKINRFILSKTLDDLGQTHFEAINGLEAINFLKSTDYSHIIVFLDLNMPVLDGYEFLQFLDEFAHDFAHKNIKVIVLSSVMYIDFIKKMPYAKIINYLNKPVDLRHIKLAIQNAREALKINCYTPSSTRALVKVDNV
ncbi:response regulator [Flectobacillus rivi]|uniref:Response regulator n=1 Tax=Flectobacillus rivi TaxID=2984209 RepID=A0ABT6YWC2_9BACT|nr:response regulator [Flectobacillus rivi]MDI9873118.1 response regulator [Flectobacillus rivi]